jgi:hypothetical protein
VSRFHRTLFPETPRTLPWRRALKIGLRAAHVLSASLLTGGTVLAASPERLEPWLAATAATGLLIVLLDLHESGAFLLQIRGAVVLTKIGLLAILPWLAPWRPAIFIVILVVSVLSSHAPSKVRYFLLAGRNRIKPGQSKG